MISKLVPICPTCESDMKPSRDHLNDIFASGLHYHTGNASAFSVASGTSLSAGITCEDQLADLGSDIALDDSRTCVSVFKCPQCGMEISVRITS
jgi:hypothetical protein